MLRLMLRPKWLGVLALVLVVAGVFALLAQWQIGRAVENATVVERDTETVVPLDELQTPQTPTTDAVAEHRVELDGRWVAADTLVVAHRAQGERDGGFWVVGRLVIPVTQASPGSGETEGNLAVALGWAESRVAAEQVAASVREGAALLDLPAVARFYPGEGPQGLVDGLTPALAPATLVNLWTADGPETSFSGYAIAEAALPGLEIVEVRIPELDVHFNWLNIVYAVEWTLFALFALYLWYRLVRDEFELIEEREAAAVAAID